MVVDPDDAVSVELDAETNEDGDDSDENPSGWRGRLRGFLHRWGPVKY